MISQYLVDIIERDLSLRLETSRYYSDKEFKDLIGACVDKLSEKTSVSESQKAELLKIVFNAHRKLGIIQPLLDDPEVNEIMINGTEAIYVEKGGKMVLYESRYTDAMQLFNVIQAVYSIFKCYGCDSIMIVLSSTFRYVHLIVIAIINE